MAFDMNDKKENQIDSVARKIESAIRHVAGAKKSLQMDSMCLFFYLCCARLCVIMHSINNA
jgi:hypothetical protein